MFAEMRQPLVDLVIGKRGLVDVVNRYFKTDRQAQALSGDRRHLAVPLMEWIEGTWKHRAGSGDVASRPNHLQRVDFAAEKSFEARWGDELAHHTAEGTQGFGSDDSTFLTAFRSWLTAARLRSQFDEQTIEHPFGGLALARDARA